MPIGKVRWYDVDRGFGFVSNPDGEDVYVGHAVLPDGVTELHKGQRIDYDYADGRPGPQALRVSVLEEPQRRDHGHGHGRGARGRGQGQARRKPAELNSMISDVISMLESSVQADLDKGRYPDRAHGRQVAEVLRAIARELDR